MTPLPSRSDPAGAPTGALVEHLRRLVACDTRNPPRAADGFVALFAAVRSVLEPAGFVCSERVLSSEGASLGAPTARWLLCERSAAADTPTVNVHVDTVPRAEGWSRDPFVLAVEGERAFGLGACDIKGALAAYLSAAQQTRGPARLLLTNDEEAGTSEVVRAFCTERADLVTGRLMIVAEPTQMSAVLAHRGIGTCAGVFTGTPGHASQARALVDSAVHEAVRWAGRVLSFVEHSDVRFNLGVLEGGTKANMIAGTCKVRFGVRPPPGMKSDDVVDALCSLADDSARVTWTPGYSAPPLVECARADALALGLAVGAPVDFFTEAALFAAAGARAFVVGPGDIALAHAADESVPLVELESARAFYAKLLGGAAVQGDAAAAREGSTR
jgi:acetylornithine deacetylase